MGFGAGVLIGLGPSARWPALAGITVANFLANLSSGDPPQIALATCLSEATECLLPAVLIERWFGAQFGLARLRHVLGLLAAATAGSAAGAAFWIVASRLFYGPTGPIPVTFLHWFMSDMVGFITLGPFVIGVFSVVRQPLPRREIIEGIVALLALAVVLAIIIRLPSWLWETALPIAWLFPMLLWVTACCRPFFAATAASLVSITVVSTTVFGLGHFGDPKLPIDSRILLAQSTILFVALCAFVLAALFAERRENEEQLAQANAMLQRERDNKLLNAQAIMGTIVHEIKNPLAAIATSGSAALRFLKMAPPKPEKVEAALHGVIDATHRTSETIDGIRAIFQKGNQGHQTVDINEIVKGVLDSLGDELKDRGVELRSELMSEATHINGNKSQLREVMANLAVNAIDAMDAITDRRRVLRVRTERRGSGTITVAVQDSGHGIDPKQMDRIFTPFFTTKPRGMGLGLAICRIIIENHGGHLTASSDGNNGTLFEFDLPTLVHGGGRAGSEQKSIPQPPKVDGKACRSALDSLPDQEFDPWRNLR